MTLEGWALIVSIVAAGLAIVSFIDAIRIRKLTKRETKRDVDFIKHLVVNSAADPGRVRKLVEDYNETGEWGATVFRTPDGRYGLNRKRSVGGRSKTGGESKWRKVWAWVGCRRRQNSTSNRT